MKTAPSSASAPPPPNPTIARWLAHWMPQPVLSWLVRLLPEWFLPPTVILKERNGEKPAESYENELDTYHHLRSLQGTYIPRLYGEAAVYTCALTRRRRPTPALLLEDIQGTSLRDLAAGALSDELVDKVRHTYNKLTEQGVVHGDPRLHNFLYAPSRDGVVAVDFEFADLVVPGSDVTNEHEFGDLEEEILRRWGRSASNAAAAPAGAWRLTPGGRTPPVSLLVADSDVFGLMGSADAVLGKAVSRSRRAGENCIEVWAGCFATKPTISSCFRHVCMHGSRDHGEGFGFHWRWPTGLFSPPPFIRIPWCREDEAERLLRRDFFSVPPEVARRLPWRDSQASRDATANSALGREPLPAQTRDPLLC